MKYKDKGDVFNMGLMKWNTMPQCGGGKDKQPKNKIVYLEKALRVKGLRAKA